MTSEVNDLLKALREGHMALDEVAEKFRQRQWPRRKPRPTTYAELAKAELEDPEPLVPGSFDDVALAYHRGELSDREYQVLAAAMAESKEAEDR
jgi:hypothetical protein